MFNIIAGPVFGPGDTPGILLLLLVLALPYIFIGLGAFLIIRDAVKRRLRRSTIVFVGIGLALFVLLGQMAGRIL